MLWLVTLALALEAAVEVGPVEVAESARPTVEEAVAALQARRFSDAASLYGALAEAGGGAAARTAQAVALYELGDIRAATVAAREAVRLSPGDPAALNVLGLVLVDGGRVPEGVKVLDDAKSRARASSRPASEARAGLNLAIAAVDLGDAARARREVDAAETLAREAGDAALVALAAGTRQAIDALTGRDVGVSGLLGQGDARDARKEGDAALARATTGRDKIAATLDLAAVDRADGRLDEAARKLAGVARDAREAGLVREHAAALVHLGLVQGLAGRLGPAADSHRAAAKMARDAGYRGVEVDARCELGLALAADGLVAEAAVEQHAAGALLAAMDYPLGNARQAELGGVIAARQGDLATARAALTRAASFYSGHGRHLDAARAATELAAAVEGLDASGVAEPARLAEGHFAAAGDRLGPAHVRLARALAAARARRLEDALRGFAEAATLAEAVGGDRATTLARVSRQNAAAALVMLGHDADLAALASKQGLGDLVRRQQAMLAASKEYDTGLMLYQLEGYHGAAEAFDRARDGFVAIGEDEYALRSRRSAGWARYNMRVLQGKGVPPGAWKALVEEVTKVDDAELYARAYGAAVVADHETGVADTGARLKECVRLGTGAGLPSVAARCHGALAEGSGELSTRAAHARDAFRLDPDGQAGVYALYAVAVDAYNADDTALALQLATLARTRPGKLQAPLDDVIAACKGNPPLQ